MKHYLVMHYQWEEEMKLLGLFHDLEKAINFTEDYIESHQLDYNFYNHREGLDMFYHSKYKRWMNYIQIHMLESQDE